MNNTSSSTRNELGFWLAIGTGIGAALSSTDLGASGIALGIAAGLLIWALRQWQANRKG
ncbi:MAG: hypothetical protein ACT4QE_17355 [Anaerolineales bacterium]